MGPGHSQIEKLADGRQGFCLDPVFKDIGLCGLSDNPCEISSLFIC
jgi:hypothetical protein